MTRPETNLDLAMSYHQQGLFEQAIPIYQQLCIEDSQNGNLFHLLGAAQYANNDLDQALQNVQKAIQCEPKQVPYYNTLGAIFQKKGLIDQAIQLYTEILDQIPKHNSSLYNLAKCHQELRQEKKAHKLFLKLKVSHPDIIDAAHELANYYLKFEKDDLALLNFLWLAEIDPQNHDLCFQIGTLYHKQGHHEKAKPWLDHANNLIPQSYHDYLMLGKIAWLKNDTKKALELFKKSYQLNDGNIDIYIELSNAIAHFREYHDACELLEKAISKYPKQGKLHNNLGTYYYLQGKFSEAKKQYRLASEYNPNLKHPLFYQSLLALCEGDFQLGWKYHHYRPTAIETPFPKPLRTKEIKQNENILVIGEQGLGDELFFSRFIPLLKKKYGLHVSYQTTSRLVSLMQRLGGIDQVLDKEQALQQQYDYSIQIADLPKLFEVNDADHIPEAVIIPPKPELLNRMREKLNTLGPAPYIGLTWRAGIRGRNNFFKCLAPDLFANPFKDVQATFISLQRAPDQGETELLSKAIGQEVHDFSEYNQDLEAMLALLQLLDYYIGVSNTNVHLRANAGRPSQVLIPYPPEYRWPLGFEYSPWYRNCKLYRQTESFNWNIALKQLHEDLTQTCKG